MRYAYLFTTLLLAGCVPEKTLNLESGVQPTIATNSCNGRSSGNCNFINSPVKLASKVIELPGRDFPFSLTSEKLTFVDANRRQWVAPVGTLTDGASIPAMFVEVIGDPRSKEFINAATVHDAYCATGNEKGSTFQTATWQDVHRMFYDGLRVGGTPAIKAKTMYAAVYLGGPRWANIRRASISPKGTSIRVAGYPVSGSRFASAFFAEDATRKDQSMLEHVLTIAATGGAGKSSLRSLQSNIPLSRKGVSQAKLVRSFKQTKAYIEATNPSIDAVEAFLTNQEGDLTGTRSKARTRTRTRTNTTQDFETGGDGGGNDGGGGGGDGGDGY
jgi:hypothetical protein